MCVGTPKAPQVQDIPIRQPVLLPDNGDPAVVAGLKNQRRLTTSAMILSGNGGSLGAPATTTPLGTTGL
jgi:hypothetical protein